MQGGCKSAYFTLLDIVMKMVEEKMVRNDHFANQSTIYHIHYVLLNSSIIRRITYDLSFRIVFRVKGETVNKFARKQKLTGRVLGKLEYMVTRVIGKLNILRI